MSLTEQRGPATDFKGALHEIGLRHLTLRQVLVCTPKQSGCPEKSGQLDFVEGISLKPRPTLSKGLEIILGTTHLGPRKSNPLGAHTSQQ